MTNYAKMTKSELIKELERRPATRARATAPSTTNADERAVITDTTGRKRAEEARRHAEENYRSLFENAVEGIYQSSPQGRFTSVNSAMARILGYASPDEVVTRIMSIQDQFYADPHRRTTAMQQLVQKGKLENFESECLRKDGGRIWLSENARAVRDARGTLLYCEGFIQDITERKRAEEALRENEERFRALIEHSHDAVTLLAADGTVLYDSPSIVRVLGYDPKERLGRSVFEFVHPEERQKMAQDFTRFARQVGAVKPSEVRFLHKDGTPHQIEGVRTNLLHEPAVRAVVVNYRDITERKQAEAERQRRVDQLAALNHAALKVQHHLDANEIYRNACDELRRFGALASVYHIDKHSQLRHVYTSMTQELLTQYVARFGDRRLNFAIPVSTLASAMEQLLTQTSILNRETLQTLLEGTAPEIRQRADWMFEHVGPSPMLVAPLTRDGRTTDLLAVVGNSLNEADVPAVTLFARHVSVALENARLFAAEQARRDELAALYDLSRALVDTHALDDVYKLIVQSAAETIRVTFARIASFEDGQLVLRATYPIRMLDRESSVGWKEAAIGEELLRGLFVQTAPVVVYADDPTLDSPAREMLFLGIAASVCLVPLHTNNVPIGILILAEERNPIREPFTAERQRFARAIGNQAASAIRRATLHEETAHRVEQLEALKSIDVAITASLDLPLTLDVLLEHVITQLHVDAAAVLLLDPYQQTLDYAAGRGFRTRSARNAHIRLGEDFAGRAALERQIVQVDDFAKTQAHPHFSALWASEGFASYYGVPLIVKGQVKGVLEVYQRAPFHPVPDWISFMEMLAGQAALAIDNAQLFQNLEHSHTDLILAYDSTIEGWSRALDLRDKETEGHTQRVTEITLRLAKAMGIGDAELVHIRRGALLHDIGKMGVPDRILLKPGGLEEDEWAIMRKHPVFAFELLSPIAYLHSAVDVPYCHHEKWDGTGYPRGLKGEQIPIAARVFAIVDVWDALRSDRPYRPAWTSGQARQYILDNMDKHFDPEVVMAFLKMVDSGELGARFA